MAVSMNVDYTRQLYTGLSTDDWGSVEVNVGDVVYIMDKSECWIFDGSTMHQLPDLGGGGGPELQTWKVTVNKGPDTYTSRIYCVLNDEKTAIAKYKPLPYNTSTEYYIPAVANTTQNGGYVIQLMMAGGHSITSLVNATEVAVDTNNSYIHYIRVTADEAVINLP